MRKQVMVRAWKIAREAVVKFGGKAKEFFSQALAIAWKEVKGVVAMEKVIVINTKSAKVNEASRKFANDMNTRIEKALSMGKDADELNKTTRLLNAFLANTCVSVLDAALVNKTTVGAFKEIMTEVSTNPKYAKYL